jgi:hypothetical protein
MDISLIKSNLNIKYYESLLYNLSQSDLNYIWLNNHYESLVNINKTDTEKMIDTHTEKKTDISHIDSDKYLYTKSWSKLNIIHKKLKIKEFVNNLQINCDTERKQLLDKLNDLIRLKILTKKDAVNYDEINGKIISLSNLQYNNNKYHYV